VLQIAWSRQPATIDRISAAEGVSLVANLYLHHLVHEAFPKRILPRNTPDARLGSAETLLLTVEGLTIQSASGGSGTLSMTSADDQRPSDSAISRWLAAQNNAPSAPLLSPGNEFPLRTLPSLPSDSSLSDLDSDEDGPPVARPGDIVKLIHPKVPTIMENEQAALNHARRRSSSLAGASVPTKTDPQKHRRRPSEHIAEEGEEEYSSDAERSDSDSRSDSTDFELDDMSADGLEDDEETGLTKRDRRRRRRRKRRNTLLDQRIVPTTDTYTKEEKKLADQNLLRSMLINGILIGLWYVVTQGQGVGWQLTIQVSLLHLDISLQQVDVQGGQGRRRDEEHLSISTIHYMSAHDCAVHARVTRSVSDTIPPTTTRLPQSTRTGRTRRASGSEEAAHDQVVLL
jgi:hypothetical protein